MEISSHSGRRHASGSTHRRQSTTQYGSREPQNTPQQAPISSRQAAISTQAHVTPGHLLSGMGVMSTAYEGCGLYDAPQGSAHAALSSTSPGNFDMASFDFLDFMQPQGTANINSQSKTKATPIGTPALFDAPSAASYGSPSPEDRNESDDEHDKTDPARRRNSEASARFRRRRKEREQETQQKLRDAEYEIRDLKDNVRDLRTENGILRELISSDSGSHSRRRRRHI